jgi:hypothetical protein
MAVTAMMPVLIQLRWVAVLSAICFRRGSASPITHSSRGYMVSCYKSSLAVGLTDRGELDEHKLLGREPNPTSSLPETSSCAR